jgi:hypothetical protein
MSSTEQAVLLPVARGFDYTLLGPTAAGIIRAAAARIRQRVKQTLDGIVGIGLELIAVKEALPHGEFGPWLKAEFGWTDRTAQRFMNVAAWLKEISDTLSDMRLSPTAAYLLSAPSAPEGARHKALELVEAGEEITAAVARHILDGERERSRQKPPPLYKLRRRLGQLLRRNRERWPENSRAELAEQLRDFADSLEQTEDAERKAE